MMPPSQHASNIHAGASRAAAHPGIGSGGARSGIQLNLQLLARLTSQPTGAPYTPSSTRPAHRRKDKKPGRQDQQRICTQAAGT